MSCCIRLKRLLKNFGRHVAEICCKAKIEQETFQFWEYVLTWKITEVTFEEFKVKLPEASQITPNEKDTELFAVALLRNLPIWSNEKALKEQEKVRVFSNQEILEKFNFV